MALGGPPCPRETDFRNDFVIAFPVGDGNTASILGVHHSGRGYEPLFAGGD